MHLCNKLIENYLATTKTKCLIIVKIHAWERKLVPMFFLNNILYSGKIV